MNDATVRVTVSGVEYEAELGGGELTVRWAGRGRGAEPGFLPANVCEAIEAALGASLRRTTLTGRLAALGRAMGGRALPPLDLVAEIIGAASAEEVRELLAADTLEEGS